MKNSLYNLYVKLEDNNYLVYNTLHDSIIIIDDKIKKKILKNNFSNIDKNLVKRLIRCGNIYKDKNINEHEIYSYRRSFHQYKEKRTHILLTINNICNCKCEYCFEHKEKNKYLDKNTSFRIRKFIISKIKENKSNVLQLDFFGGEPFINSDIIANEIDFFNNWCNENNVKVLYRFYTNGTIITSGIKKILLENTNNIKDLQITLDGPKEIHDKLRPLKNNKSGYSIILKNLKKLKKLSIPVNIRINFTKKSYKYITELLEDLMENNLNDIPVVLYAVQSMTEHCSSYGSAIQDKDTYEIFSYLWKQCLNKGFNIVLRPKTKYLYCSASCVSSFVINYLGDVYKCALLQTNEKYKVGFINKMGILNGLKPEYYRWMNRDPLMIDKCKKCVLLPICGGGCAGSSEFKFGTYMTNNCFDINISLIKERLKLYYKHKYNFSN